MFLILPDVITTLQLDVIAQPSSWPFYFFIVLRRSVVVSGVGLINEVNRHWVRLVLGWVTVCGRVNHLSM